ncbi:MAG: BatA domain-containing protein [Acidobacteria bacterium]|nr:BatA domain-containing protein [Acidobacteriota bacterium]
MQFLAPLFLLGALAIAGPIILHLIRRERSERLPFASLMFFRRIPRKDLQRQKLKYLFLLLLRCLAIALIVSAFARPVLTREWWSAVNPSAARSVLILLDHSLSMSAAPVWEKALAEAKKKIHSLHSGDEGMLVQFGETVEVVSGWERSPAELLNLLRSRVSQAFEATSYVEALRLAADQFQEARNAQKEIFLITDFQRSGLGSTQGWKVPAGIKVTTANVGQNIANLYIAEARIERQVFTDQYFAPIVMQLRHFPPAKVNGTATFYLEEKPFEKVTFQTDASGKTSLSFQPFPVEPGVHRGRIVVEPADALPQDNTLYFVLEKQKAGMVPLLTEENEFFLISALSTGENIPFEVRQVRHLEPRLLDPSISPVVILNDVARPPSAPLLAPYLEKGGGLVIILGNSADPGTYENQLGGILPVTLTEKQFARTQGVPFVSITDANWQHPIFSIFQDSHKPGIVSTQFYGYWKLEPKAGARILARFSEGVPAMIEGDVGAGRVLIFASSLQPVWNDFPLRSSFLPFWQQVIQYASRWTPFQSFVRVNQLLPVERWSEGGKGLGRTWNVLDPRGQRVFALDSQSPQFLPLKLNGHYEIRERKKTDWIAVNTDPNESDLARLAVEDFQAALVPGSLRSEANPLQSSIEQREQQQSLWWLFLGIAALLLLVEAAVANAYYGNQRLT